jgi:hypothetical protein
MGIATFKTLDKENESSNEVILQITKKQIVGFFRFLTLLALITVNAVALYLESSFIKELLLSQSILAIIYFIKITSSNTIKK